MSYIDGFVIAVPTANKQKFINHGKLGDGVFMDLGATRILECWGDDVPAGKLTDFRMAVKAKDDETVVFSWIEWPDKATRDEAYAKMQDWMKNPDKADPRMNPAKNPMPFDGTRMIFGGFAPLLDLGKPITGLAPAVQPYLFFRGRCEEAIEYYKSKLDAEVVMMMRFSDNPDKPPRDKVPAELDNRIMHAAIRVRGTEIMMSDGMKSGPLDFQCMSLSLAVPSETEADQFYDALAADGAVQMPIGPTFFAKRFGAIADKFGVSWMIMVPHGTDKDA
jgi:uncharacterized protein YbaA (DUF1428 family)/uncharacterized glyoxalase superfamily protein PhnB